MAEPQAGGGQNQPGNEQAPNKQAATPASDRGLAGKPGTEQSSRCGPPAPPAAVSRPSALQRLVTKSMDSQLVKTLLDTDAVRNVAAQLKSQREARFKEKLDARPARFFEPIRLYKKASLCSMKFDDMGESERVGFCQRCQLQVYDFSKMELAEAQQYVFHREGKSEAVLYRRKDGKFLTQDCPVGLKRKIKTIGFVTGGSIVGLVLFAILIAGIVAQFSRRPVTSAFALNEAAELSPVKTSKVVFRPVKMPVGWKYPVPMGGRNRPPPPGSYTQARVFAPTSSFSGWEYGAPMGSREHPRTPPPLDLSTQAAKAPKFPGIQRYPFWKYPPPRGEH